MGKRIRYIDGYEHYGHRRDIQVIVRLNEAERAALDDLMAVLGQTNISRYIRSQIFLSYHTLTRQQKRQLREVRQWRKTNNIN